MPSLVKSILATLAGLAVAVALIAVIELVSSWLHSAPTDLDLNDPAQFAEHVHQLPLTAFAVLLLAWSSACFGGTFTARLLAPHRSLTPPLIVAGLLLLGIMANLTMLPHPVWFTIAGPGSVLVFSAVGMLVSSGPTIFTTTRLIAAPIDTVFETLSHVEAFAAAVPHIVKVEFLSEQRRGVGTRFRETRLMQGKQACTELEVTELVELQRIRMVSEAGGTIWDTVFTTESAADGTRMTMCMEARPQTTLARCVNPLIMRLVAGAIENDMNAVQTYCEQRGATDSQAREPG